MLLPDLIKKARTLGADAADAVMVESVGLSVARRLGKPEGIERDESRGVGLRVFIGKKQAIVSSTDMTDATLTTLVERAIAMAIASPEDPYTGLAETQLLATTIPNLDLFDTQEPSAESMNDYAARAEEAARAVPGVTNSEGADAGYSMNTISLATSNGFYEQYKTSSHSFSVSVLAGSGTGMERDYDYSYARHRSDLSTPETIGEIAGQKAVKRLNPRKVDTCKVPVVFDPRVANSLLSSFASAINGTSIARGTSFLKQSMGKEIFNAGITITDDPFRIRGLASKPFDAEGVQAKKQILVQDGILQSWLLDIRSANQLGLTTTGHASRGLASNPYPSTTNLYLENGTITPEALIRDIKSGFYITDTFGMGVNTITGDYSQGANGFWIENGEIAYPVSEVTIASTLQEMFRQMIPANDLTFRYGTNAPTLRVDNVTVAGK